MDTVTEQVVQRLQAGAFVSMGEIRRIVLGSDVDLEAVKAAYREHDNDALIALLSP